MSLTSVREDLATLLTSQTDVTAHAATPGSLTAPCIIICPGDPYLSEGEGYNAWNVRLNVFYVARTGTAKVVVGAIEGTVSDLLGLDLGPFVVEQVDIDDYDISDFTFSGARLSVVAYDTQL